VKDFESSVFNEKNINNSFRLLKIPVLMKGTCCTTSQSEFLEYCGITPCQLLFVSACCHEDYGIPDSILLNCCRNFPVCMEASMGQQEQGAWSRVWAVQPMLGACLPYIRQEVLDKIIAGQGEGSSWKVLIYAF